MDTKEVLKNKSTIEQFTLNKLIGNLDSDQIKNIKILIDAIKINNDLSYILFKYLRKQEITDDKLLYNLVQSSISVIESLYPMIENIEELIHNVEK